MVLSCSHFAFNVVESPATNAITLLTTTSSSVVFESSYVYTPASAGTLYIMTSFETS